MSSKTIRRMTPQGYGPAKSDAGFEEITTSDQNSIELIVNAKGQVQCAIKVYFEGTNEIRAIQQVIAMEEAMALKYGKRYAGYQEPEAPPPTMEDAIAALNDPRLRRALKREAAL